MRNRAGFALAAALVGVVLIGVLITGVLFSTSQESHATAAEMIDQQVFAYAERAAAQAATSWECPECDGIAVGSVIIRNPAPSPPLESTVFITRLDSALYLVTGEGRITGSGAAAIRRRVSVAVKIARDSLGQASASRIESASWTAAWQM
jgi:hypothetical protein